MLATILHDPCASPLPGRGGGKGMEKAGGNRAQELSSNSDPNRPKYAETVAPGGHQSPSTSHGKEGRFAGTRRVHLGTADTRGHARRLAT